MDFSFLWPKTGNADYEIIEVTFPSGPLNMFLGQDRQKKKIFVQGFQLGPDGQKGVAEICGRIRLKDELMAVNDMEVNGASLRWTVSLIMRALWPMTLRFRRPLGQDDGSNLLEEEVVGERRLSAAGSQEVHLKKIGSPVDLRSRTQSLVSNADTDDGNSLPSIGIQQGPKPLFAPGISAALDRALVVAGNQNVALINQAARLDAALVRVKNQATVRVRGITAFYKELEKLPSIKNDMIAVTTKVRELKILLQLTQDALMKKERRKIVKDFARESKLKKQSDQKAAEQSATISQGSVISNLIKKPSSQLLMLSKSSSSGSIIGRATAALFGGRAGSNPSISAENDNMSPRESTGSTEISDNLANAIMMDSETKNTGLDIEKEEDEESEGDDDENMLDIQKSGSKSEHQTDLDSFYNPFL